MPWPNKGMSEEEMKEMFGGLTPKEIGAKLKELDNLKASMGNVEKASKETEETVKDVKSLLVSLQKNNEGRAGGEGGEGGGTPTDNNGGGSVPKWSEDADAAFMHRVGPLVNLSLETRAEMVYNKVARRHASDWDKYEKEIQEILTKSNVQQKSNEEYVDNVYYLIRGRHADDIARDNREGKGTFFIEPSRTEAEKNEKTPEASLSDKEKETAAKLGIPLKDYAESKKTMDFWK